MSDDQGWGDVGYNGHPTIRTPHLDQMAAEGMRFDRFYAAAPVCSPTRGSVLTGRHPYRYGIYHANAGSLPRDEVTIAEALGEQGYLTGHFGKWHLGTLTTEIDDGNRGGREEHEDAFSAPWMHGFDRSFSTESSVPLLDPSLDPVTEQPSGTHYWTGPDEPVLERLRGDDSAIIMDRALAFVRRSVDAGRPFLAMIWFHTPHHPIKADPTFRSIYRDEPHARQHYLGALSAMDLQIGRLRGELGALGAAENTMLWFCSDNGPEDPERGKWLDHLSMRMQGSTAGLRGRKYSLLEGGVRVPGLLVWPRRIAVPRRVSVPCSTLDLFPTALAATGWQGGADRAVLDGESLMPLIVDDSGERSRPLPFWSLRQRALIDGAWKIYSDDGGRSFSLFNLRRDPGESHDVKDAQRRRHRAMIRTLRAWQADVRAENPDLEREEDFGV